MNLMASLGTVCGPPSASIQLSVPALVAESRRKVVLDGECKTKVIMDFVIWVSTCCAYFPSVQQVQDRFNVSRATAFRWRRSLADCLCMADVPRNPCPGTYVAPVPMAPLLRGAGAGL